MDRKRGSRSDSPQHKRQKVTHEAGRPSPAPPADNLKKTGAELCAENLAAGLLNEENVVRLRQEYVDSEPFKYARVETLFQDDLLRNVKDECITHLSFTEKETDIYRVCPFRYDFFDLFFPSGAGRGGPTSSFYVPSFSFDDYR